MSTMEHSAFGTLTLEEDKFGWIGVVKLPSFAAFDIRHTPEPSMSAAETWEFRKRAQASVEERLAAYSGREGVEKLHATMDQAAADYQNSQAGVARALKDSLDEYDRQANLRKERFARGEFNVNIEDEEGTGPSREQIDAFGQFIANERRICDAVMKSILNYYQDL